MVKKVNTYWPIQVLWTIIKVLIAFWLLFIGCYSWASSRSFGDVHKSSELSWQKSVSLGVCKQVFLSSGSPWSERVEVHERQIIYRRIHLEEIDESSSSIISKKSLHSRYRFFRLLDKNDENEFHGIRIPILFIPGHRGHWDQARHFSFGSEWFYEKYTRVNSSVLPKDQVKFDFFSIDFDEESSFVNGLVLRQQALFVNRCILKLLKLYHTDESFLIDSIVLFAHSTSGLVAQSLFFQDNYIEGSVRTIFSFGSPYRAAPIYLSRTKHQIYQDISKAWSLMFEDFKDTPSNHIIRKRLSDVIIVSFMAGDLDRTIPAHLSNFSHVFSQDHGFNLITASIPFAAIPTDHHSIVTCGPFIQVIADALQSIGPDSLSLNHTTCYERLKILSTLLLRDPSSLFPNENFLKASVFPDRPFPFSYYELSNTDESFSDSSSIFRRQNDALASWIIHPKRDSVWEHTWILNKTSRGHLEWFSKSEALLNSLNWRVCDLESLVLNETFNCLIHSKLPIIRFPGPETTVSSADWWGHITFPLRSSTSQLLMVSFNQSIFNDTLNLVEHRSSEFQNLSSPKNIKTNPEDHESIPPLLSHHLMFHSWKFHEHYVMTSSSLSPITVIYLHRAFGLTFLPLHVFVDYEDQRSHFTNLSTTQSFPHLQPILHSYHPITQETHYISGGPLRLSLWITGGVDVYSLNGPLSIQRFSILTFEDGLIKLTIRIDWKTFLVGGLHFFFKCIPAIVYLIACGCFCVELNSYSITGNMSKVRLRILDEFFRLDLLRKFSYVFRLLIGWILLMFSLEFLWLVSWLECLRNHFNHYSFIDHYIYRGFQFLLTAPILIMATIIIFCSMQLFVFMISFLISKTHSILQLKGLQNATTHDSSLSTRTMNRRIKFKLWCSYLIPIIELLVMTLLLPYYFASSLMMLHNIIYLHMYIRKLEDYHQNYILWVLFLIIYITLIVDLPLVLLWLYYLPSSWNVFADDHRWFSAIPLWLVSNFIWKSMPSPNFLR